MGNYNRLMIQKTLLLRFHFHLVIKQDDTSLFQKYILGWNETCYSAQSKRFSLLRGVGFVFLKVFLKVYFLWNFRRKSLHYCMIFY